MMVLVGYASEHGSTRDIARGIATKLEECGSRVDTLPVDQVQDLGRYDAFVLGSAIHDQKWLPPAIQFVSRHLAALATRPVWLFSVGMPGALPGPLHRLAMTEAPKVIAGFRDAIGPRDHRLFSGVVHPGQLSFAGRLLFRAVGGRYGDFRNWTEIDTWAADIADQLIPDSET